MNYKRIFDFLILFGLVFAVIIFAIALLSFMNEWSVLYKGAVTQQSKMFWISILIGVVAGYLKFFEIYIQGIAKTLDRFNKIKKEVK